MKDMKKLGYDILPSDVSTVSVPENVGMATEAWEKGHLDLYYILSIRLAPVLKTIFHQCVISYTCSQSKSNGSVLKRSHQS